MSGYRLGVDLGTTWTAAAVARAGGGGAVGGVGGGVEVVSLGNRAAVVPSLVLVKADGEVLVGEAAARRGATEPDRLAREFKRRIGDPAPVLVGGAPWSADGLTGLLLRGVVDQVASLEGGPPDALAVAHPANWGEYKQDLLRQAVARADLDVPADRVVLVSEPEAAAAHYAAQQRVAPGSVVAVYDLGGGTFDVAVLRKTATAWGILGEPQGVERLGGIDFDEAVFGHVVATLGLDVSAVPPVALARLRADCVEAKETLSSDTAVAVPVPLDVGGRGEVRLTRSEFEDMVRAPLAATTTALRQALRSAGVAPAALDAVLLVGGSSRIPLVGQLVGHELGRPVAIDAHPKHAVALGAALLAPEVRAPSAPAPAPTPPAVPPLPPLPPPPPVPVANLPPNGERPLLPVRGPVRGFLAAAGVVAAVVVGALLLQDGDGGGPGPTTTSTTSATSTTTAAPLEVPQFDADYDGTIGEGDELIAWLASRESQGVHLDLTFVDEPIVTDSPPLWTDCDENMPPGAVLSTEFCRAAILHIRVEDGDESPFYVSRGRTRLEGYFLVGPTEGPFQGFMSVALDPISAADALDRTR